MPLVQNDRMYATDLFVCVYLKTVKTEMSFVCYFGLGFLELGQHQVRLSSVTKTDLMHVSSAVESQSQHYSG